MVLMNWTSRAALAGLCLVVLSWGSAFGRVAPDRVIVHGSAQAMLPGCQSPAQETPATADAATALPPVAQALQNFDQGIGQFRAMHNLASMSVAIVYGQDVIYARGFGCADLTAQTPATPPTIYDVGSVTKMMTATMLMQLRDAGKLQLNDPVNMYVPEATYLSPSGMTISPTFQQLASHSSGLPRDAATIPTTNEQLFQELQMTTAVSEPGTAFLYSNFGFAVLGQVLAQIAGQPYEQYVEQNILAPLGMTSSTFTPPASAPSPGWATPYDRVMVTAQGVQADARPYLTFGPYFPALGLYSTALDMAQFIKLQFRDGPAGGDQILSGSTLQEMRQQVISAAPALVGIGIGWEIYVPGTNVNPIIGKDGADEGFQAQMMFVPGANVGVFVVANTASTSDPTVPQLMFETAEAILLRLVPPIQQALGGQQAAGMSARPAPGVDEAPPWDMIAASPR
jgi:CubicO group peptidase (beta-lactamase class C family)